MGVEEGRFGVRFRPGYKGDEGLPLKFPLAVLAVAALISFVSMRGCGKDGSDEAEKTEIESARPPQQIAPQAASPSGAQPPARTASEIALAEKRAARWLKGADLRAVSDKTLLERLAAAERRGDEELILTTLEKLRMRPGLADLNDAVSLRIGEIRAKRLFTIPANSREVDESLVVVREVRRTDNIARLAREYGTTIGLICRMNALDPAAAPAIGSRVRILKFPRMLLSIHRRTGVCDLYLNDRFFHRYYAVVGAAAKPGPYVITEVESPESLLSYLGVRLSETEKNELSDLLPPGAKVVVAN